MSEVEKEHIPGKVDDSDIENMKQYGRIVRNKEERKVTEKEFEKDALAKGDQEAQNVYNLANH